MRSNRKSLEKKWLIITFVFCVMLICGCKKQATTQEQPEENVVITAFEDLGNLETINVCYTLKKDIMALHVAQDGNVLASMQVPAGGRVVYRGTDGHSYVDFSMDDGSLIRLQAVEKEEGIYLNNIAWGDLFSEVKMQEE